MDVGMDSNGVHAGVRTEESAHHMELRRLETGKKTGVPCMFLCEMLQLDRMPSLGACMDPTVGNPV